MPPVSRGGGFSAAVARAGDGVAAAAAAPPLVAALALHEIAAGTPRRRALARGHRLLDRLESLERALLAIDGGDPALDLGGADGEGEPSGDPALDGLLAQIALRVAIEQAKLARGRVADAAPLV
jgi:hypothetical protein